MSRHLLVFLACLPVLAARAGDVSVALGDGSLEWTAFALRAGGSAEFPVLYRHDPQRKLEALERAREKASARLWRTLLRLPVDSATTLADACAQDPDLAGNLQRHVRYAARELPYALGPGTLVSGYLLGLTGPDSVWSRLARRYPHVRLFPSPAAVVKLVYHHTGLVIDAREQAFVPSFGTRFLDQRGTVVYDPAFTDRRTLVAKGPYLCLTSLDDPRLVERAGRRFLYLHPKALTGRTASDLVFHDDDVARLLGSEQTKAALRDCRVVILCRDGGHDGRRAGH